MADWRTGRAPFAAAAAAAVLLAVGAYANHFHNAFHFDDFHVIEDNLHIRSLTNAPRFFTDASTFSALPAHQTYRPLLSLSYALDYRIAGGLDPVPFHATQLLLHLLVALGLFLVFRRAMDGAEPRPSNRWIALFGALWFAVHTANTETINYLSARSDIVSTLGIVAGFALYLCVPGSRRFHVYLLPMVLGALAKPSAVMFAPLLLAWVLLFEEGLSARDVVRPESGQKVWSALLRVAPALLLGVALFLFVEGMNPEAQTYGGGDRLDYLRTQAWVWLHYARLFALPFGLTADTDMAIIPNWYDTRVVLGIACLALLAWVVARTSARREWRPAAFGLVWFVLGLLPASSVFPLAEVANEHRLYLPLGGLVLAACWTAVRLGGSRTAGGSPVRGVMAVGLLVLTAHTLGTVARNEVWRTEETLWADVVRKSPSNGRAWMNYGLTQLEAGRVEEARDLFLRTVSLLPHYPPAHVNLGIATNALGDTVGADAHFRRALELSPDHAAAKFYYGRYLLEAGRGPEAIPLLEESAAALPGYAPPRRLLLQFYYVLGAQEELTRVAEGVLRLSPADELAEAYLRGEPHLAGEGQSPYERGVSLTALGRHLDAAVAYRRHSVLDPSDADAYNNLGWSLARLGFDHLAALAFEQALQLNPDHPRARGNLELVRGEQVASGT